MSAGVIARGGTSGRYRERCFGKLRYAVYLLINLIDFMISIFYHPHSFPPVFRTATPACRRKIRLRRPRKRSLLRQRRRSAPALRKSRWGLAHVERAALSARGLGWFRGGSGFLALLGG